MRKGSRASWKKVRDFWLVRRDKDTNPAINYLRNVGGGLSVLGLIGILPFPEFYWWCVGAFYLGILLLIIEALLENWTRLFRFGVCLVYFGAACAYTFGFVLAPTPLDLLIVTFSSPYPAGTKIGGIEWSDKYTDLEVDVGNSTAHDYDDVDLVLHPDQPIAEITELDDSHRASFDTPKMQGLHIDVYHSETNSMEALPAIMIAADEYTVHFDSLPAHSIVKLAMALVKISPSLLNRPAFDENRHLIPDSIVTVNFLDGTHYWYMSQNAFSKDVAYADRPAVHSMNITSEYRALQRNRSISQHFPINAAEQQIEKYLSIRPHP